MCFDEKVKPSIFLCCTSLTLHFALFHFQDFSLNLTVKQRWKEKKKAFKDIAPYDFSQTRDNAKMSTSFPASKLQTHFHFTQSGLWYLMTHVKSKQELFLSPFGLIFLTLSHQQSSHVTEYTWLILYMFTYRQTGTIRYDLIDKLQYNNKRKTYVSCCY